MKQKVYSDFVDFVTGIPLKFEGNNSNQWPSEHSLDGMIRGSWQFKSLVDIGGLTDQHKKKTGRITLDEEVQYHCLRIMSLLEDRWIRRKVHDCFGIKDLEECILQEIGTIKDGYSDALTFIKKYYQQLNASIFNTLYYSDQVFARNELELMVPNIESPFYDRDQLIEAYLKRMEDTKT